jgi:hypothetical protein
MTPDEAETIQFFLLRGVVERLEREVGSLDEMVAERLFDQGKLHLVFALRHAREALAAGISDPIRVAQVLELERAGGKMQREYTARERGRSGGNVTGPRQHRSGQQTKARVLSLYQAQIKAGSKPADAKRTVADKTGLNYEYVVKIVGRSLREQKRN